MNHFFGRDRPCVPYVAKFVYNAYLHRNRKLELCKAQTNWEEEQNRMVLQRNIYFDCVLTMVEVVKSVCFLEFTSERKVADTREVTS